MRPHNDPMNWWLSNPTSPEHKRDGLPAGVWVLVNGVRRFETAVVPYVDPTGLDHLDHALLETIARNLAATATDIIAAKTHAICAECGCLITPTEVCPGCLVWAERALVAASWRMAEERFTTTWKAA